MNETISPEVECLKLKSAINENHRLAQRAAADAVGRAILAGDLLLQWKELLTHGKFEVFVEKHFEGSLRSAQRYMQAAKAVKALPQAQSVALLSTEDTLAGLLVRVKKNDGPRVRLVKGGTVEAGGPSVLWGSSDSISEKGRPGGADRSSLGNTPASSAPDSGEAADSNGDLEASGRGRASAELGDAGEPREIGPKGHARTNHSGEDAETGMETKEEPQETDPRPPRSGKERNSAPVDYGKCPACASSKWKTNEFGVVDCAKCGHPHGEPRGNEDEGKDPAGIARAKCVKTCEALLRALDDLNLLSPRAGAHKQSIDLCKSILKTARNWK